MIPALTVVALLVATPAPEAEVSDATVHRLAAEALLTGADGPADSGLGLEAMAAAAALGDAIAALRVLEIHRFAGTEPPSDLAARAGRLVEEVAALAAMGDAGARTALASAYLGGVGVEADPSRAAELYREVGGDYPWAAHNLGWMYQTGTGVAQDDAEALRWFLIGAERGNLRSLTEVAGAYFEGRGVGYDPSAGQEWLRRAAEREHPPAMEMLAQALFWGQDGAERDRSAAIGWWRKAAEAGNTLAAHRLGLRYLEGEGVAKDRDEGVRWILWAAEQGFWASQMSLARAYDYGYHGFDRDHDAARAWYERAAAQGVPEAIGWVKAEVLLAREPKPRD